MKRIYFQFSLALIFLFSFSTINAQAPTIEFEKTLGGNTNDILWTSIETSDGGFLLGGYSHSNISGDKTENSKGSYDYWIVKTNPYSV